MNYFPALVRYTTEDEWFVYWSNFRWLTYAGGLNALYSRA